MTTTQSSGSATIYQFPQRGRFAVNAQSEASKPVTSAVLPRGAKIVSGGAWYHDEAIQDDRTRNN